MSFLRTPRAHDRRRAWLVPVATVAVVAGGAVLINGVGATSASASEHPSLPAKSADELLSAVLGTTAVSLSGTVTETARWGLPSLPGADGAASLSWQGLLTGSHTLRVAVAGPTKQRIAVLGSLSESDVIHNGKDLWTYTSSTNAVTHSTLTDPTKPAPANEPSPADLTPQAAAQSLLAAIDPSTVVSVDRTQVVAGRSAYTLVLTPRDTQSTLRKITIAVDAQHNLPLALDLYGASSTPAFQTQFTSVSFSTPSASTFDFTPPKDASVTTDPFGTSQFGAGAAGHSASAPSDSAAGAPRVLGAGWTSIIEVPASPGQPGGPQHGRASQSLPSVLGELTSPVGSSGDRVLHTAVLNVLITADGRIFAGAVTPAALENAAARNPR